MTQKYPLLVTYKPLQTDSRDILQLLKTIGDPFTLHVCSDFLFPFLAFLLEKIFWQ